MWRVMAALWENGDRRLGDIAARTSIDISTLSRLLGTLQRKKFIVRRRSGKDGRALSVSLTEKGRAMTERIIPIASHYEEVATRGMKQIDLERLKKMLIKLFSNMHVFDEEFAVRRGQNAHENRAPSIASDPKRTEARTLPCPLVTSKAAIRKSYER